MIKIKDEVTKEVWKIQEPVIDNNDTSYRINIKRTKHYMDRGTPTYECQWFKSLPEAITWVQEQIKLRRELHLAPKPKGFWD